MEIYNKEKRCILYLYSHSKSTYFSYFLSCHEPAYAAVKKETMLVILLLNLRTEISKKSLG